jgi:hypothetical protein
MKVAENRIMSKIIKILILSFSAIMLLNGCGGSQESAKPRLSMFVGMDISGSFVKGKYYEDALDFLSNYLYCHLNGYGGLEVPNVLFVSSIGGAKADEPKTFYPIQTFQNKSVAEIRQKLNEIFPKNVMNPFTDYNAFFEQVALTVKNKNLVLRPIAIVMLSDGIPDVREEGRTDIRSIVVTPLELLARSVTIRLLYTGAVVGKDWQTKVRRNRVKIWTQDAEVMVYWKDPKILIPNKYIANQTLFFDWLKDNVDFGVRSRRVD